MIEKVTFRDANIEDLPTIVAIYNSTVASRMVTADTEPVSIEERTPWFNEHNPSKRPLWVVEYEGEICGWISFQSFYGRPAYDSTAELSIYLDEKFRGKGIGKLTLKHAIDACPSLKIQNLLGFIFAHNDASLHLFVDFQFEKWAHLPEVAELDGVKRDLIIMGKKV
ncbi:MULTISPECIES: GNAT family N-acetyltransferase [unclassified Rummeliibacillus]|uniref:GNAT family N-acetyltransferase n=1 Tax=unclassified Rummeliibacillus TaxID=2622809 RepID=UPI000E6692A7|nr:MULTISPECIES: GNAT family N-acetyltransferase [unclassified Rummeliibacillus]RIJ66443.1 N-acetyltransferase family protein [Rummeliibacillus sp. POC4]RPJ94500.1 N-acetyltransferase family protein [Rummeliibacillus sp. TYF005]